MSYVDLIGSQADYRQHPLVKPRDEPCPPGATTGKRKPVMTRRMAPVAALHRRSWIVADGGISQARCACCKSLQAAMPGVPSRGRSA